MGALPHSVVDVGSRVAQRIGDADIPTRFIVVVTRLIASLIDHRNLVSRRVILRLCKSTIRKRCFCQAIEAVVFKLRRAPSAIGCSEKIALCV